MRGWNDYGNEYGKIQRETARTCRDGQKKKNVLEYKEINEVLKDMELDSDAMDKLYEYLEAYGIDVLRIGRRFR